MARKRIRLAQNFLKSREVVASIVSQACLDRRDVVYEIGPGRGAITRELARVCSRVVAIEVDPDLCARLRARFRGMPNVEIVEADFLGYRVRERRYKIVSNIPFNATAGILRAILHGRRPPAEAYLIVQREAAHKYAGIPRSTQCSVLARPWFDLRVIRSFRRSDFEPEPAVDSVLLRIARRDRPLVRPEEEDLYGRFVRYGFNRWRRNLRQNLKRVFTHTQWKRLATELGFERGARPGDLTFGQWLGIFQFFVDGLSKSQVGVPEELRPRGGRRGRVGRRK